MARQRGTSTIPRSIIASAAKIRVTRGGAGEPLPRREEWQTDALAFRRDVPEIGFATRFVGNTLSKLIFYVGYRPHGADPNTPPIPVDSEDSEVPPAVQAAAMAELDRLRSGQPSMGQFTRRFAINLDMVGECYLVGRAATETSAELWEIRSLSEVQKEGDDIVIVGRAGGKKIKITADDECTRLYIPDEEWMELASSPMIHLITDCRTLQVLTQQMYAEASSRLSAGFLLVPSEVSPPPSAASGDEAEEDELLDMILEVTTTPLSDPSSAASVAPSPWRVAAEYIDKIRHLTVQRAADGSLDERAKGRIERIARGLDLPVEVVMGHQQTTYANASQVDRDTFDDHLAPRCITMAELLTAGFLTPHLKQNPAVSGTEWADRLLVCFDPAPLIASPNPEDNANDGHDRGTISDAAWRRAKGFDEQDAPTAEELIIRLALKRGIIGQDIANAILRFYATRAATDGEEEQLTDLSLPLTLRPVSAELEQPAIRNEDVILNQTSGAIDDKGPTGAGFGGGTGGDVQTSAAVVAAAAVAELVTPTRDDVIGRAQRRPNRLGRKLYRIDHELRTRVHVAASAAMERAMEKAGNRIRTKAGAVRAHLKSVPPRLYAHTLNEAGVWTEVRALFADGHEALFEGAWDDLEAQVMEWGATAQAEAIAALSEAVASFTAVEREQLGLRMATNVGEAWGWFKDNLNALAEARLLDPAAGTLDLGEGDPLLSVPFGLVRNAIAYMGGKTDIDSLTGEDAWIAVPDTGGIGLGDDVLGQYRTEGGEIEAYQWQHGGASRPLESHVALDGEWFLDFEDPVLENTDSFPDTDFLFPGDHLGCTCDFIPILLSPEEAGA